MIERIRGIKVQGRCFSSTESFVLYPKPSDRIALVYGKNGSGKSTISEAFASIANNSLSEGITASVIDAQKYIVPLTESPQIFVFNEKYIDENVKIDDDGLGTIILFGGQVDLQSEIDTQASIISSLENDCTDSYAWQVLVHNIAIISKTACSSLCLTYAIKIHTAMQLSLYSTGSI